MPFLAQEKQHIPTKDLISWIFDDQTYDQDKPIYLCAANPKRSISSRQARKLIRQLVAGFREAGLKQGDTVCVHSFNDVYYPILFLGIIAAGGIFAGTNPSYTTPELIHHIRTSHTKFLLVEPELLAPILEASQHPSISIPKSRIWLFDEHDSGAAEVTGQKTGRNLGLSLESWRTLLEKGESDWVRFDDLATSKKTTAARLYSSGTTGLPKAAVISHYNLVAQHTSVFEWRPRGWEIIRLVPLPMFHAAIVPAGHVSPLRGAQVSYIMRRFELPSFLSHLRDYSISDVVLVPPILIALMMSPLSTPDHFRSIKQVTVGAAPLQKSTQERFKGRFLGEGVPCTQVWGMTETSCIATVFYHPEGDDTGSVGRPIPNLDMKLVDPESGQDISKPNTRGELCVRGPTVVSGYFENDTANRESFDSEGYFRTGDIMFVDGDSKKWYIVDRKKELIKVRGFQVAPPELEAVLLAHPAIVDAAVIGVSSRALFDSSSGSSSSSAGGDSTKHATPTGESEDSEYPRAYIVRRPGDQGAKLTAEDVRRYFEGRLARYKQLDGGVAFVDAIPKNASGKILKRVLRELAAEELKASKRKGGARM